MANDRGEIERNVFKSIFLETLFVSFRYSRIGSNCSYNTHQSNIYENLRLNMLNERRHQKSYQNSYQKSNRMLSFFHSPEYNSKFIESICSLLNAQNNISNVQLSAHVVHCGTWHCGVCRTTDDGQK